MREHPAAGGLAAVVAFTLLLQLIVGIAVAPNNWDSMTYHLARVAYWLQFDSALHFDNGTLRQLAQPPNGEFLQAWTLLITGGDALANLVQWISLVGLGAAIAAIARVLGFDRPAALFAAALFVAMPEPILQATSTQNDVITSFVVVAALLFGLRGLRDRSSGDLAIFGMSTGLALGAKGTALLALPAITVPLVAAAWRFRSPRRTLLAGAVAAAAGLMLLGSFNYILNADTYGDPLGPLREATERTSPVGDNAIPGGLDVHGLDRRGYALARCRAKVNKVLGDRTTSTFGGYTVDNAVNEDTSAYGLLGVLAMLVFIVVLVSRRTPWDRRAVAAAALGYLVLMALTTEYNQWLGRVMMPGIAIGAPLLATLYRWGVTRGLAVALALLSLLPSLFTNPFKPLFVEPATPTVFALGRIDQQALSRPEMNGVLKALAVLVEPDAPVGLVRSGDSWDYSFFGDGLERRVVPLEGSQASVAEMRRQGLDAIVFANMTPPRGLRAQQIGPDYWLALAPDR